jgi:crotonobetainyl-CoA:carnitine CoA-transferase CaiB-like acyl-CoA transferase
MSDVSKPLLTTIGVLEILGGVALILPWATGIATFLTPLAAIAFVVLMILAAIFHARRPGEATNIAFNLVLGVVAAFIAWGRIDALRM